MMDPLLQGGVAGGVILLALMLVKLFGRLLDRLPSLRRNGNGKGSLSDLKLAMICDSLKEVVAEQRTGNELTRDLHRDLKSLTGQLDRIERDVAG